MQYIQCYNYFSNTEVCAKMMQYFSMCRLNGRFNDIDSKPVWYGLPLNPWLPKLALCSGALMQ